MAKWRWNSRWAARRYTELALLVPGATEARSTRPRAGWAGFVANGNYQTQNNSRWTASITTRGRPTRNRYPRRLCNLRPDAIGEFKVQTNSYSRVRPLRGRVVNVVIKSGTNGLHGSVWYYNRNKELAADTMAANLIEPPGQT